MADRAKVKELDRLASLKAHDDIVDYVVDKYQDVDLSLQNVVRHSVPFTMLEKVVNPTPVIFRAVSYGEKANNGRRKGITYHWGCFRKESRTSYMIKMSPRLERRLQKPMIPPLNGRRDQHRITYRAHRDLVEAMTDAGCHSDKEYEGLPPDLPIEKRSLVDINAKVSELMQCAEISKKFTTDIKRDVNRCIKQRIADFEERYKWSSDAENLTKALFWKNLKYEDLTDYHRAFVAVIFREWFNLDALEHELRAYYEEKIIKSFF